MFNVSMRIVNDYAEAEDVLQESFVSAFKEIHTYKGDASFGSWLKRIVINRSLNHLKSKKLVLTTMDENLDCADDNDSSDYEDQEWQLERIKRCIQQLLDGYRVVLTLYLLEGYDHQEVGEILGISESTSKSQYSRAKKKLQELMQVKH